MLLRLLRRRVDLRRRRVGRAGLRRGERLPQALDLGAQLGCFLAQRLPDVIAGSAACWLFRHVSPLGRHCRLGP